LFYLAVVQLVWGGGKKHGYKKAPEGLT